MIPEDFERLRTWQCEIAEVLLPVGAAFSDEGDERKYHGHGGFWINRRRGCWYSFTDHKGGYSAIALIAFLKQCTDAAALEWAEAWLASHEGFGGTGTAEEDSGDHHPASAAAARGILPRLIAPESTPAETYLRSRRIAGPIPPCVRFLPNARVGEGAVVGILTARGRTVGVQVGYLDPDGRRTTVPPFRRRYMLEKIPEAVFEVGGTGDDLISCEGLEDALSVVGLGRPARVVGVPGVGNLKTIRVAKGDRVLVVRDGDEPGSEADKELHAGIDEMILAGAEVDVTPTDLGQDANAILQNEGLEGLSLLLDCAVPAELSRDGVIRQLAALDPLAYDFTRKEAAKRLGIRVGTLDDLVEKARKEGKARPSGPAEDDAAAEADAFGIVTVVPWPEPVDGATLLTALDTALRRYVVMSATQRAAIALWVLLTHAFDAAMVAPKLAVISPVKRCGKTRLLTFLGRVVCRPLKVEGGISPSALFRLIEAKRPTAVVDETDTFVKGNEELRGIVDAGFERDAKKIISVRVGDNWEPRAFALFCPQVLAGIGELHETIADRSITISLERKARDTKVLRLRRRDGGDLGDLARMAARWAADNTVILESASPKIPEALNDRAADFWEILLAIADAAGGDWPMRSRAAAVDLSGDGVAEDNNTGIMLLSDIRDIFAAKGNPEALTSSDLVAALIDMEDRPWPEFRHSQPISMPQLARALSAFHISPGTLRVGRGTTGTQKGYKRRQFDAAFKRYLPSKDVGDTSQQSYTRPDSGDFADTPTQDQDLSGFEPDFEGDTKDGCVGSKNPENPSNGAGCDGVSAKNGEYGDGYEYGQETDDTSTPEEGSIKKENTPNGKDNLGTNGSVGEPPGAQEAGGTGTPNGEHGRSNPIAEEARKLAEENPTWSNKRIAKHIGIPIARIDKYLGPRL